MTDDRQLVMNQGPQPGQTFSLNKDTLGLGRDPGNEIVINDPQVSRQHARITRQGGLVVIEDLGSTNGTFVNGVRLIEPHTLANSDVIGLGNTVTLTYYGGGIAATEILVGQPTVPAPPSYAPPPPAFEPAPVPSYAQVAEEQQNKTKLWVGCGCAALLALACIAVGLFLWYAPESFWQALIDLGVPVPTWPF